MGGINFEVAALCIFILNFYLFFARNKLFIAQTRLFLLLMIVSFVTTALNVSTVVTYWQSHYFSHNSLTLINLVYFLSIATLPLVYTLFFQSIGGKWFKKPLANRILITFPWIISITIVLSTPLTGLAFRFTVDKIYQRGSALPVLYFISFFYAAIAIASQLTERRRVSQETRKAIFIFVPVTMVPVLVQFAFPAILVQGLGLAFSEMIILLTVQDFGRYFNSSTGLYNRDGLIARLNAVNWKRIPFTVYLVCLDSVEFLQNALGSEDFTALEKEVSKRLKQEPLHMQVVSRISPGNFALVSTKRESMQEQENILEGLFTGCWRIEHHELSLNAHLCAIRFPEDCRDIERIFLAQNHLSRFSQHYPENHILRLEDFSLAQTDHQLTAAQALKEAVRDNGFEVFYQPIVESSTGKVIAAEALVRLSEKRHAKISPAQFIPLAELDGSIYTIGEFVLEKSACFLAQLRQGGHDLAYFEVNLSALQCLQTDIVETILSRTRKYTLESSDFCLEITETATRLSPALMNENMAKFVAAGFRLAIDDYGTGYSNVEMMLETTFHTVKIDRSMITAADQSEEGRKVLEDLIMMFKSMDLSIVAEGVETGDQLAMVESLGVDLIQGYYYSRPLPEKEFVLFLDKRRR